MQGMNRWLIVSVLLASCGTVTPDHPASTDAGTGGQAGGATGTGGAAGAVATGGASPGGTTGAGGQAGAGQGTGGAPPPVVPLTIRLAERDLNASDSVVAPHFELQNDATTPLNLADITLRYWYTEEGADGVTVSAGIAQSSSCDFAGLNCSNVTMTEVPVSPARTGANFYFEVGFTSGAGQLAAGANTNELQFHVSKQDFSNYNELDDYSYLPTTSYTTTTKVTAYWKGQLVYGVEP